VQLPHLFTLEWTHPPNREQPDGAADLLNTNSQSVLQFTTVMSYVSQTSVYYNIFWLQISYSVYVPKIMEIGWQ